MNTKPQESDYSSHVSYCRALGEYCWKLEHLYLSAEKCASDLSKGCAKLEDERDHAYATLEKQLKDAQVAAIAEAAEVDRLTAENEQIRAELDKLKQQEPVGSVTVSQWRGLENIEWQQQGDIPEGTHMLYLAAGASK